MALMALSWEFVDEPDLLFVRVEGEWLIRSTLELIESMGQRCQKGRYGRVLCDMRGVRGPMGELDRYLSGAHVASVLKSIKLALVAPLDAVITGFGANVAARRGGHLYSTKDIEEARQWLFAAAAPE